MEKGSYQPKSKATVAVVHFREIQNVIQQVDDNTPQEDKIDRG